MPRGVPDLSQPGRTQQVPTPAPGQGQRFAGQGQPAPAGQRFASTSDPTQSPQSTGSAQRLAIPEDNPHRKWPAILVLIAIIVGALALVWIFVGPATFGFGGGEGEQPAAGQVEGEGAPAEGEQGGSGVTIVEPTDQTSSTTSESGVTWNLNTNIPTPVTLQSVTDDGVSILFEPGDELGYITMHITSCEINGETHDPLNSDDPISYTVVNRATGETVQSLDPYFITSPNAEGGDSGTVVTIKVEGLTADQYDSVNLTIDESVAKGDINSGEYDTQDVNGLTLSVTKG